ncbi:hypothetical protein PS676_04633 [Pseudomonas fluorescens]|nr:hypothetical protein PS676_04633 [Pseudomonas fluorescens]
MIDREQPEKAVKSSLAHDIDLRYRSFDFSQNELANENQWDVQSALNMTEPEPASERAPNSR